MVSTIWKVASEGDLEKVKELLNEPSSIDIEIKGKPNRFSLFPGSNPTRAPPSDHTGATPLIQAVRNGHRDVVKELLQTGGTRKLLHSYRLRQ
jgi:ankyrin repeat protein